jgi:hypothetical protein
MTLPTSKELEREMTAIETDPGLPQHVRDLARTAFNVGRKAQHVATLASLSPQTGLEEAAKAMYETRQMTANVIVEWGLLTEEHREAYRILARAAAPVLLAAKEREIERLSEAFREASQRAAKGEDAESRCAALEGALKNLLSVCNDLDRKVGISSDHGIYCIEARRVIELRALLDRRHP